ncbi:MAG: cyclopropane-fatty-acyl-phospholipid synthase family protein [Vampirovibrio sp.]|nr:cyclopropane-fatty-acyl-phospholipid synthase family protein [Vampirovibrio sp.]
MAVYQLLESNLVPEPLIRMGIRRMLAQKIQEESYPTDTQRKEALAAFVSELRNCPIAIETDAANDQHYELPPEFFTLVLGPWRKYSSGLWAEGVTTLQQAEEAMLTLYCQRADIKDGQTILDLGCGWGSMSLWLATHYPNAKIVGFSNSNGQREFIESECVARGITNLQIVTGNIAEVKDAPAGQTFDRVISIEMFEHMKNYEQLLAKINRWLSPKGKLFVHIFTHKTFAYHYEDTDGTDWLTRYFFTGGTMPSDDLLFHFQEDLAITKHWEVEGTHYQKTANEWLANMHRHRKKILPILAKTYGPENTKKWWVYWRVFFLACAELWGYKHGREWQVSHYLFEKQ